MKPNIIGTIGRSELPPEFPQDAQFIRKDNASVWGGAYKITDESLLFYFGVFEQWRHTNERDTAAFLADHKFLQIINDDKPNHLELEAFFKGYCACALWASIDEEGEPLNTLCRTDDIEPATAAKMLEDCSDFLVCNRGQLLATGADMSQHGHDFWLTRNGHGAGFWDRGYPSHLSDHLTAMANAYGSFDLYLADNGEVCGQ